MKELRHSWRTAAEREGESTIGLGLASAATQIVKPIALPHKQTSNMYGAERKHTQIQNRVHEHGVVVVDTHLGSEGSAETDYVRIGAALI